MVISLYMSERITTKAEEGLDQVDEKKTTFERFMQLVNLYFRDPLIPFVMQGRETPCDDLASQLALQVEQPLAPREKNEPSLFHLATVYAWRLEHGRPISPEEQKKLDELLREIEESVTEERKRLARRGMLVSALRTGFGALVMGCGLWWGYNERGKDDLQQFENVLQARLQGRLLPQKVTVLYDEFSRCSHDNAPHQTQLFAVIEKLLIAALREPGLAAVSTLKIDYDQVAEMKQRFYQMHPGDDEEAYIATQAMNIKADEGLIILRQGPYDYTRRSIIRIAQRLNKICRHLPDTGRMYGHRASMDEGLPISIVDKLPKLKQRDLHAALIRYLMYELHLHVQEEPAIFEDTNSLSLMANIPPKTVIGLLLASMEQSLGILEPSRKCDVDALVPQIVTL